ncbi:MAG: hypothetical protein IPO32_09870 [Crocinitomicaceae bacterium]|nr:hypothetical protein [Crocinitomicaceae bacterium]
MSDSQSEIIMMQDYAKSDLLNLVSDEKSDRMIVLLGEIDHGGIAGVINSIESIMKGCHYSQSTKSRCKLLCIEILENSVKHGLKSQNTKPYFRIQFLKDSLKIKSGNALTYEDYKSLSARTEAIKKLTLEEVNEEYMKQLKDGKFYGKSNAGLGMLSIAKRSYNLASYEYEKVGEDEYYCILVR